MTEHLSVRACVCMRLHVCVRVCVRACSIVMNHLSEQSDTQNKKIRSNMCESTSVPKGPAGSVPFNQDIVIPWTQFNWPTSHGVKLRSNYPNRHSAIQSTSEATLTNSPGSPLGPGGPVGPAGPVSPCEGHIYSLSKLLVFNLMLVLCVILWSCKGLTRSLYLVWGQICYSL